MRISAPELPQPAGRDLAAVALIVIARSHVCVAQLERDLCSPNHVLSFYSRSFCAGGPPLLEYLLEWLEGHFELLLYEEREVMWVDK